MFQTRTQEHISEKLLNEKEISNVPEKEFKVVVTKMLTGMEINLGRTSTKS